MASPANDTSTNNAALQSNMDSPEDLDIFVKELMDNMQTRFNRLSDSIVGRIDEMGSKIDELEKSINELMDQAGAESTPSDNLTKNAVQGNMKR
mmetsp:Transcript_20442/g.43844  ORF Transcript_20442/g.43844 Transcript_20442/m.43844 type:complete len:94 (-) Transcript_20442:199-480(-)|eukprot:CAMPEP_0172550350 /NCGR_PEP_ID=MMETSP1067-20121228/28956_1 /TAXON_ID=265564 ORGANISM="Thalassiosira punctigera, Strain Tpunct2005C2" /NCGR_SAMPLE_ID=MMETSP1067 /ASSEMBLY_ACC=CAM_ASM_000444 /LENGTH=93 /DNA_ID=CAMNT_0013337913 /DNA_START=204 /DNA_END=485 /DNA_ORIENTATION=+